ncbi:MAG: hypothetical protein AB9M60_10185 [Leptothrix sp. (in: b-proteobacteria)]
MCLHLAVQAGPPAALSAQAELAVGKRLYEQGLDAAGEPLAGVGAGGVRITSGCADCHRRSGMGGAEGNRRVPPITAIDLFQAPADLDQPAPGDRASRGRASRHAIAPSRRESRAAYTDASLARALRDGIDASGRPLHSLMPRYGQLDDASMRALGAYLRTLYAEPAPGWRDGVLQIATIVTPDASAAERQAVQGVLTAWAAQRRWIRLQVWTLTGDHSQWPAQLAEAYAREPVFAVLSGAGGRHWQVVQDFCEARALPCVLPIVDAPAAAVAPRWSMYFSAGLDLEARALAQVIQPSGAQRVLQLVEPGRAEQAAQAFSAHVVASRSSDAAATSIQVDTRLWDPASPTLQAELANLQRDTVVVAWLGPQALDALWARWPETKDGASATTGPDHLLLCATLSGFDTLPPLAWRARTRMMSSELDPRALRGRTALGLLPWARQAGVAIDDERLQAKAYAATGFFSDALARMAGRIDRAYLLETLERGVDNRPYAGPFVALSLGPDQRVAGKSADLLDLDGPQRERWHPLPGRYTP